jgi:hypothetical protein
MFLKTTAVKKSETLLFYRADDLFLAETVDIFGRTFIIYNADGWTQNWFGETFGLRDPTAITLDDRDGCHNRLSTVPVDRVPDIKYRVNYAFKVLLCTPRKVKKSVPKSQPIRMTILERYRQANRVTQYY